MSTEEKAPDNIRLLIHKYLAWSLARSNNFSSACARRKVVGLDGCREKAEFEGI